MARKAKKEPDGFGFVYARGEGMPIHPNDSLSPLFGTDPQSGEYQDQLKRYKSAYGVDPENFDMDHEETRKVVEQMTAPGIVAWVTICRFQAQDAAGAMTTVELQQHPVTMEIRTV